MSRERTAGFINEWRDRPNVSAAALGLVHWAILKSLVRQTDTAGNVTTEAHICCAALALEYDSTACSADDDFNRFSGVTHINPLADTGR